jgi:hypothetical protein
MPFRGNGSCLLWDSDITQKRPTFSMQNAKIFHGKTSGTYSYYLAFRLTAIYFRNLRFFTIYTMYGENVLQHSALTWTFRQPLNDQYYCAIYVTSVYTPISCNSQTIHNIANHIIYSILFSCLSQVSRRELNFFFPSSLPVCGYVSLLFLMRNFVSIALPDAIVFS